LKRLTDKAVFEAQLRNMIGKECRRRKTGRHVVLSHVVRVVNSMRDASNWHWRLVEDTPNTERHAPSGAR
jgi:hypothetical protein